MRKLRRIALFLPFLLSSCAATARPALDSDLYSAYKDAEIVSLDSMQVYRGMDVGTAKPSERERAEVLHHLVDVADPCEEWSVVRTQEGARDAVAAIEARGKRALLVGGTALYVRAVVDAVTVPGGDAHVRSELEAETATESGLAAAYASLQSADPDAAARIEPGNRRRVVRALEVLRVTGRPFSSFGPGLGTYSAPAIDVAIAGVWLPRAVLARRIEDRFAAMRERGLVDEVRRLATAPGGLSRTARQAIGYKEVLAHLEGGLTLEDALDLAVRRTRAFARRQRMWFRRDPRIVWFASPGNPEALGPAILATLHAPAAAGGPR